MLIFMVFIIICQVTIVTNKNAGSTIFNRDKLYATCWTKEDIAKLRARKAFEDVIPPPMNPEKINTQYVEDTLLYFNNALRFVRNESDKKTASLLYEALCDTIGAHLTHEILPRVRFAYYAGYIPYRSARKFHDFYDKIKTNLNTQGLGWKSPEKVVWTEWSHLTVSKIPIGVGKDINPCASLKIKRDLNNCIHLDTPTLDDINDPSAISLPFKTNGLVSLTSPNAENTLLKYYTTAARCILHSSPEKCRHADFVNLNSGLWHWMKRDVASHLVDEKLFAAYGGVLRIAAAVQSYGKGLTRRNLFHYNEAKDNSISRPWRLCKSNFTIDCDWSPRLYVVLVILTAIVICVLQACYNYMFGMVSNCRCRRQMESSQNGYSKLESKCAPKIQKTKIKQGRIVNTYRQSSRHVKPHKVYDLNDDTEKMISISINGHDDRETGSSTSKIDSDDEGAPRSKNMLSVNRSKSPPKIETSIAQLTIGRQQTPQSKRSVAKPMYSTSTLTHSDFTFCQQRLSDSAWSPTSSSTSGKSVSSTSSKSRSQRSRQSRDVAWARHVILKHSQRSGQQMSSTEVDRRVASTPPLRR